MSFSIFHSNCIAHEILPGILKKKFNFFFSRRTRDPPEGRPENRPENCPENRPENHPENRSQNRLENYFLIFQFSSRSN